MFLKGLIRTCNINSIKKWFLFLKVFSRVKVRISGLSEIRIYPDHFCNRKPMPQIRIPEFSFFGGMNTILEHFFVTKVWQYGAHFEGNCKLIWNLVPKTHFGNLLLHGRAYLSSENYLFSIFALLFFPRIFQLILLIKNSISNHLFLVTFVMIHFMDVTPIIRQDGLIWFRSFKRVENEGFLIKWV